MASRTADLKPAVREVAERLAVEHGSLKHMLSAAVLAFEWCSPDERRVFMLRADGKDAELGVSRTEKQRAALLAFEYWPKPVQEMLLAASRGEQPLDTLLLDQVRLGVEHGLRIRDTLQQRGRGSKASRRGR